MCVKSNELQLLHLSGSGKLQAGLIKIITISPEKEVCILGF